MSLHDLMSCRSPLSALRDLLHNEAIGALVLVPNAGLALIIANSLRAETYFGTLKTGLSLLSMLHWINDTLMVVFFLLVSLGCSFT